MKFSILLFSLLLLLTACGDSTTAETTTTTDKETATEKPVAKNNKYTLTPFTASTAYSDAKLEGVTIKDNEFNFSVAKGTSYQLGAQTPDADQKNCANSAKGQHLHVIIDDKPYAAKYTANFNDLKLEDGEHRMLAFLSRSYHESIKTDDAHLVMEMRMENGSMLKGGPLKAPMIWYSRPKGTYKGKANTEKIMLDFYLVNTTLTDGRKVKVDINGEMHMVDTWQPYYIEGLPMGKNKITLSLVNADGSLVDAPQNPISREFTLEKGIEEM